MDLQKIDEEMARLAELREKALAEEQEKLRVANLQEARDLTGQLVDILKRLGELGTVPPRLQEALRDEKGKFNPGLYIKRPPLLHRD